MTRKVAVALFDKDLKCEIKKYPLNSDGTKIEIQPKGGKGHFMPAIDNDSKLYVPLGMKKYLFFGKRTLKELYFTMKWSKTVVNFKTGAVEGPDPDVVMEAARAEVIKYYGKGKLEIPWYLTVFLVLNLVITLLIAHIVGVY